MKTAWWIRRIATLSLTIVVAAFAAGCEWPWDDDDDDKKETVEETQSVGNASMTVLVKRGN